MSGFEQVDRVPGGINTVTGAAVTEVAWTGRMRRPESVGEWREQRRMALGQLARLLPARSALAALLAADDPDVKAIGAALTLVQRHEVWRWLAWLEGQAADSYPPAAGWASRVRRSWARRWGDKPPGPERDWVAERGGGRPVVSMAATWPPDPASVAAAWEGLSGPLAAAGGYGR